MNCCIDIVEIGVLVTLDGVPIGKFANFKKAVKHVAWMGLNSKVPITIGLDKQEFYEWLAGMKAIDFLPKELKFDGIYRE